jgi:hypothetical protein
VVVFTRDVFRSRRQCLPRLPWAVVFVTARRRVVATTIAAGFRELAANLEITNLQADTVSTRQQNVRDVVERELTVLDSFLVGSYGRDTMIGPLADADIDIFVVLSSDYYKEYTPSTLLDRLRAVLLKTYTRTPKINRNGQAVTITFEDFRVDVVPAFRRQGGGYLIPDSPNKAWIATNPPKHDEVLTQSNRSHHGDLVPLVKMVKGWNKTIDGAFRGFYLELLVVDVLRNVRIDDYPSGVEFVLDKGREAVKFKRVDPAGFGDQVNPLDGVTTVADAVSRFETAYNRAVRARAFAANGKVIDAFGEWRKIFGNYFPSYG